jgi:DMSO/TMAO reductase YedYZ molybdopterin-dependent catalytic subunit
MPMLGMRVRHHCVEGWSAIAEFLSELPRTIPFAARRFRRSRWLSREKTTPAMLDIARER